MYLSLRQQPGAEGKHLHCALFQVLLRGQRVAVKGLHAAVLIHRHGIQVRPGALLFTVAGFGGDHFTVADDHAMIIILGFSLADRNDPQAVHIVGNCQHRGVLFDQILHMALFHAGVCHALQLQAVLGSGLDHAQRGIGRSPDFRYAVFLLLFLLRLFPETVDFNRQVFGSILPDALVLVLEDILLPGIVLPGQEALFIKMPAVLLRLLRKGEARQQEEQNHQQACQFLHHLHRYGFFFRI